MTGVSPIAGTLSVQPVMRCDRPDAVGAPARRVMVAARAVDALVKLIRETEQKALSAQDSVAA